MDKTADTVTAPLLPGEQSAVNEPNQEAQGDRHGGGSSLQEAGRLLALAWPLCLEQVLTYGAYLITMSAVGRLGAFPLSVFVMASAVTNVTGLALVIGLAGAVDTFAAQAFGASRHALLGVVLQRALLINLAASVPPILLWALGGERLLWWAGEPCMAAAAMRYARLWSPVLVLHGSSQCIYRYLVAQGVAKPIMAAGVLCCAAALPLNWLFIFRLGWGLHGAIAATVLTEAAYLALLLASALVLSAAAPPEERPLTGFSREALKGWGEHLRIAVPAAAMVAVEWLVFDLVNLIAGILPSPEVAVAVSGVAFNINSLLWMLPNALGMGVSAHVGNTLGAGQASQAKMVVEVGLLVDLAAMAAAALGIQLAGWRLFAAFTSDHKVLKASRRVVAPLALSVIASGAAALLQGTLRGAGRQAMGVAANLGAYYAVGLPCIAWIAARTAWGVEGLWWALCGAGYLQAALLAAAVLRFDWRVEVEQAARRVVASQGEALPQGA